MTTFKAGSIQGTVELDTNPLLRAIQSRPPNVRSRQEIRNCVSHSMAIHCRLAGRMAQMRKFTKRLGQETSGKVWTPGSRPNVQRGTSILERAVSIPEGLDRGGREMAFGAAR